MREIMRVCHRFYKFFDTAATANVKHEVVNSYNKLMDLICWKKVNLLSQLQMTTMRQGYVKQRR